MQSVCIAQTAYVLAIQYCKIIKKKYDQNTNLCSSRILLKYIAVEIYFDPSLYFISADKNGSKSTMLTGTLLVIRLARALA